MPKERIEKPADKQKSKGKQKTKDKQKKNKKDKQNRKGKQPAVDQQQAEDQTTEGPKMSPEGWKKELVRRGDQSASFFVELAAASNVGARGAYPVIDVGRLDKSKFSGLAALMRASFATTFTRPQTPIHENDEGKLPLYPNVAAYVELGYFGGAGRLVVDVKANPPVVYFSWHYKSFYILEDKGAPPARPVAEANKVYQLEFDHGKIAEWEKNLREGRSMYKSA